MILAANDVADAQIGVVGAGGQVIRRHAIRSQQSEIFDVRAGLPLLPVNGIGEAHHLSVFAGHAKAQRKTLSGSDASVALLA